MTAWSKERSLSVTFDSPHSAVTRKYRNKSSRSRLSSARSYGCCIIGAWVGRLLGRRDDSSSQLGMQQKYVDLRTGASLTARQERIQCRAYNIVSCATRQRKRNSGTRAPNTVPKRGVDQRTHGGVVLVLFAPRADEMSCLHRGNKTSVVRSSGERILSTMTKQAPTPGYRVRGGGGDLPAESFPTHRWVIG